MALTLLNADAIRGADRSSEPYDYLLGRSFLKPEGLDELRRDFPAIDKPGYLTVDEVALKGRFKTIMKRSQPKYGAIHTDGPSKVMTMLVYMNDSWEVGDGGRLRVLYDGEHFEPYAVEVPPTMGTVFAFLRGDASWHGHRPFVGERKVVQIAWVTDKDELARKKKRNRAAQFFKGIFGR